MIIDLIVVNIDFKDRPAAAAHNSATSRLSYSTFGQ